jgi:hypothetical protein
MRGSIAFQSDPMLIFLNGTSLHWQILIKLEEVAFSLDIREIWIWLVHETFHL